MVRLEQMGVARSTPDYPAMEVMNSELGGLFSSRINLNLREEHGYTYGANSFFIYRRSKGHSWPAAAYAPTPRRPPWRQIFNEIRRIIDTPMTPAELSLAKDSQSRSLPGMFEANSGAGGALSEIFMYNLAPDYFQKLPERLNA